MDVEENDQDRTETIYDARQDARAGKGYRLSDFGEHRMSEARRMTDTAERHGLHDRFYTPSNALRGMSYTPYLSQA